MSSSQDDFTKEILWYLELSLCKSTSNGPHIPGADGLASLSLLSPFFPGALPSVRCPQCLTQRPGASSTQTAKGSFLGKPILFPRAPTPTPQGTVESKSPGCQVVLLVSLP